MMGEKALSGQDDRFSHATPETSSHPDLPSRPPFSEVRREGKSPPFREVRHDGAAPALSRAGENLSDGELIRRAQAYDSAAFAEIYDCHYEGIYTYIYCRVNNTHVAEDLAAEAFLRALEGIGSFQFRGVPIAAWLHRIASNLVNDYFREQARRNVIPLQDELLPTASNPSDIVERQFTYRRLQGALRELTDEQRQVVVLRFVQGLDIKQIAYVMGKPEGAIKSLQHRALGTMGRFLGKDSDEAGLRAHSG
jgi:RNA polymerase sigma-70 factor (ECF subfamily)